MKTNQSESGSVHLIITVVLVVTLLGALGFIFWQNVINADSNKKNDVAKTDQQSKTSTSPLIQYCSGGEKLCFDYPGGWSVSKLTSDSREKGYTGDDLVVQDVNSNVVLTLHSGIDGLGGACPEEDQAPTYILDSTKIPKMTGFKSEYSLDTLQVARAIYKNYETGKYVAALYVTGEEDYTKAQTLSSCGIILSQFIPGRNALLSSEANAGHGAFEFGYTGSGRLKSTEYDTVDAAKKAHTSPAYTQAALILSSLRYE